MPETPNKQPELQGPIKPNLDELLSRPPKSWPNSEHTEEIAHRVNEDLSIIRSENDLSTPEGRAQRQADLRALIEANVVIPDLKTTLADATPNVREAVVRKLAGTERRVPRDEMTKLAAKGFFTESCKQVELQNATDISAGLAPALTIIKADAKYLKPVNDRLDHIYGDAYLIACAEALQAAEAILGLPDSILARTGGDEFGIILPAEQAELFMQTVRTELKRLIYAQSNIRSATDEQLPAAPLAKFKRLGLAMAAGSTELEAESRLQPTKEAEKYGETPLVRQARKFLDRMRGAR